MKPEEPAWNESDDRTVIRTVARRDEQARPTGWTHSVVVVMGAEPGRRYVIADHPLIVGRKQPADILVAQPEVSAQHCRLQTLPEHDALLVTDLQSTNGSFVDGRRLQGPSPWLPGGLLQVGDHFFRHEFQPAAVADAALELERDLEKAGRYVLSLLPPPITNAVLRTEYCFKPSARLGGDAFGCQALDEHRFAGYVIDVCGHGAGSAMHTVSVLNTLRQRALPNTDFARPSQVLERLNAMFPMDGHGDLYFSIWYGVYDARDRCLSFAGAGHHPAYLRLPNGHELVPLGTRNPLIGVLPEARFTDGQVTVDADSRLYIFSDGAFEIVTAAGVAWRLADFLPLLLEPEDPPWTEPDRLYRRVLEQAAGNALDDDFSVLTVTFLS